MVLELFSGVSNRVRYAPIVLGRHNTRTIGMSFSIVDDKYQGLRPG